MKTINKKATERNEVKNYLKERSAVIKNNIGKGMTVKKFIKRIENFKEVLKEVELIPLEETIQEFEITLFPLKYLAMWEKIAEEYALRINENPNLSMDQKILFYKKLHSYYWAKAKRNGSI